MKKKIDTVVSVFDGISCAYVALQKAGFKIGRYFASEIDKPAILVSKKNHPDIFHIGDIKNVHGNARAKKPEYIFVDRGGVITSHFNGGVDLLIGGSPCQDLSIAKKDRKGLSGSRSGLFWEFVRLLKEIKPKYFILENVASMPQEAKDTISEALGVQPIMINAALVSAQQRKRLFWTNIPGVTLPSDKGILLKDILEEGDVPFTKYGIEKLKSNTVRSSGRGSGVDDKHNWDTVRVGQFGNGGQGDRVYSSNGKSVALSANGGGRGAKTGLYLVRPVALRNRGEGKKPEYNKTGKANALTTVQTDSMVMVREATKKGYAIARDGRVGDKAKNLMTSSSIGVFKNGVIRKLTPVECERLQGLPDGYTHAGGASNNSRYKMLGNAFHVDVVAHILSFIK